MAELWFHKRNSRFKSSFTIYVGLCVKPQQSRADHLKQNDVSTQIHWGLSKGQIWLKFRPRAYFSGPRVIIILVVVISRKLSLYFAYLIVVFELWHEFWILLCHFVIFEILDFYPKIHRTGYSRQVQTCLALHDANWQNCVTLHLR